MAYSNDRRLIQRTRQSAKALEVAATWVSSRSPLDLTKDFVFELYVLFELVLALMNNYKVTYVPGNGNKKHNFPKKPAQKVGRPKFEIYTRDGSRLLWQLCAGTKIIDIVNMQRAPDISLQNANSSDEPTYNDIEIIWDAKLRADNSNRIDHNELSEFARFIDLLKTENPDRTNLNLEQYRSLLANCLITNGRESTEPNIERVRLNLKEIANFFPGEIFRVHP